ncbi:unnamed protein product [Urochloa decumbens]|uniref:Dof zinc finger protein n=1 Tax=Urochloa decumbens TaxID=240449 RepID=A0ABC9AZX7_9POAL
MDSIYSHTIAPSAIENNQEAAATVASPPTEEAGTAIRNVKAKQARQQQAAVIGGGEHKPRPQQEKGLKCPRCPSTNTKFCYYNNNSLTQPRYICKSCRRYWTAGGIQRDIPVGGGCRKNKQRNKAASSSASSSDSKKTDLTQKLMMMPTATAPLPADFPNVLPTFMSTTGGGQLITPNNLAFAPLPLPPNTASTMPSFVDMLRGGEGFQNGGSNGMAALPVLLPAPSFGAMLQHGHGMMLGDHEVHLQGVDQEVKSPTTAAAAAGVGSSARGGAVQEQEHQAIFGGDGGTAAADNNHKGCGISAGSIINYWQ